MMSFKQYIVFVLLVVSLPLQVWAEESRVAQTGSRISGPWKINMKNADIREFITQISAITGKTFIIDQRVKGKVTVISNTLIDADATYQLFLSVLRVHGFAAVPAGNVVKIVQQVLAKQSGNKVDFADVAGGEQLITRVVPVANTSAVELVKILRPMIPQYGHIAGLNQPNALIISDHADNILRLINIVNRIDVADTASLMIIQLKEAWVEDIVALLEKIAPEQIGKSAKGPNTVRVVASERTNSLVFKGDQETLNKMKALVEQLDQPASRSGSIQVVRLAHADATEMAELLKNLVSETSKSQKAAGGQGVTTSIQADKGLNALVIKANPTEMRELKEIIDKLDVRRLQVLIEAAIVEVTTDFTIQLGSELAIADASLSSFPIGLTAPAGALASALQALALGTPLAGVNLGESPLLGAGKFSSDGTSFAVIIRALAQNSNVNLLSTPSIMTMDNQEAKIVVGQNVPFRTGSSVTGSLGATNPFTTITREDVGLTLQVTPHIHDGNLVRLEIHTEVSEVDQTSLANIGSDGSADLITNKRTIDTTILADNGEIIILGGLMRDKYTYSDSKVPLLGDIPWLGRLFKSTSKKVEKLNLLVFLRPTVLSEREDISKVTKRKYSGIWEVEIKGTAPAERLSDLFDGKK